MASSVSISNRCFERRVLSFGMSSNILVRGVFRVPPSCRGYDWRIFFAKILDTICANCMLFAKVSYFIRVTFFPVA